MVNFRGLLKRFSICVLLLGGMMWMALARPTFQLNERVSFQEFNAREAAF